MEREIVGVNKEMMKQYRVFVFEDRTEWYNLDEQLHREEGAAVEWADGGKHWYINNRELLEDEFNKAVNK